MTAGTWANGRRLARVLVVALWAVAAATAHAGRSCDTQPPTTAAVTSAMTLAEHTAAALERSGADVVVLARAGQNLTAYGLRYSHLGFAYREGAVWRVVHKLNECGSAQAAVYRQGLGEFVLDDLWQYEVAFVVPTAALQARLLPLLRDDAAVARLHTPAYSVVAYPWAQTYQQSNQWAIETLAMAAEAAATTRPRAQAWLQLQGYEPTQLHLSALQRLGARVTAANVAFDDHPNAQRFADRIDTVTVDSVFAWLNRQGFGSLPQVVR